MTSPTSSTTQAKGAPGWLPWLLVALAVALLVWQHLRVGALSDEVAALKVAPAEVEPAEKKPNSLKARYTLESLGAVERRMDIMEQRLKGLDGRVRRAERMGRRAGNLQADTGAAMALMAASDGDETPDEVAALREDVDALLTGEGVNSAEGKKALETMMEQRETKRRERWMQRSEEAAVEWLEEVGTELGFDDATKAKVSEIMASRRTQRTSLFEQVRSDTLTMREARTTMKETRTASDEALKTLLGEADYQRFQQKEKERRGQRRGGL